MMREKKVQVAMVLWNVEVVYINVFFVGIQSLLVFLVQFYFLDLIMFPSFCLK